MLPSNSSTPLALPEGWQALSEAEIAAWADRVQQAVVVMPWLVEEDLQPVAVRTDGGLLCHAGAGAGLWYVVRWPTPEAVPVPEFSGDWNGFLAAEMIYVVEDSASG